MASGKDKPDIEDQAKFIAIIKDYPVVLEKSHLPSSKQKRSKAIGEIQMRLETEAGVSLDGNQILKRFNNMKTRVKAKVDTNKTGNKKIVLKPWEEELQKFIEGDSNPAIVRLKGKIITYLNN